MAYLSQRNGKWHLTWKEGRTVKRKSTGCTLDQRAKAEVLLEQFELEQKLERIDPTVKYRKMPLTKNVEEYAEWLLATGATAKHVEASKYKINRVIAAAGIKKLTDITAELVERTVAKMQTGRIVGKGKKAKPNGPTTRNKYKKAIKAFCNWLHKNQRTDRHLLINLGMENEALDVRKKRTKLTDEEFAKLYKAALESEKTIEGLSGPERAMLYYLAAATGLRKGELASITPTSFSMSGGQLMLTVEANFTKSGREDEVPIPAWAFAKVDAWLMDRPLSQSLFPLLKQRKTEEMIKGDLKAAGVPYRLPTGETRDFHALRHTFISRCFASGAPALMVMAQARHQQLSTTQGYGHSTGKEKVAATNALPPLVV